ncbi:replication/maintenance protein RepL [Parashewanella tropica]|uniref:replication/maintenance protein RepL n=1 Tax=Parashewanella tropica TaxID=2547970 RepID=UPI0010594686|nr:replication/maintenance protein RepL [Parashewanella tropica]
MKDNSQQHYGSQEYPTQQIQKNTETFLAVYVDNYKLHNLSTTDIYVLEHIATKMQFNSNKLDLSTKVRKDITKHLSMKKSTFSNRLRSLKQKNAIIELDATEIMINPYLVFKGLKEKKGDVQAYYAHKVAEQKMHELPICDVQQ